MRPRFAILSLALLAWGCIGPAGTYCQSGPKHGTQCYSQSDVETRPTDRRRDPAADPRR